MQKIVYIVLGCMVAICAYGSGDAYGAGQQSDQSDVAAVVSPSVMVLPDDEFNRQAQQSWEAIPNKADAQYLDSFIKQYPSSDLIPPAFTIRYNLVKASKSPSEYNRFIATYPDTLAAQTALQEVFSLYLDKDRISWYLDFMARYPGTSQALVAKMHAQLLSFQLVAMVDRVEEYDSFMAMFPDAPQTLSAEELAKQRAVADEFLWLQSEIATIEADIQNKGDVGVLIGDQRGRELRRSRSRTLVTQFQTALTLVETAKKDPSQKMDVKKFQLLADRNAFVILEVYADQDAADAVREEVRYQHLLQELQSIHQTIQENHQELVKMLREEFQATRDALRQGFELLHLDNQATQKRLDDLNQATAMLHQDLINVNLNLVNINRNITDVNQNIARSHELLAVLHQDLEGVNSSLSRINSDLNKGFQQQLQATQVLTLEVKQGFHQLHQDVVAQTEEVRGLRVDVRQGFQDVQKTQLKIHQENLAHQEKMTGQITSKIDESTDRITTKIDDSTDRITTKLDESTDKITTKIDDSTDKITTKIDDSTNRITTKLDESTDRITTKIDESTDQITTKIDDSTVKITSSIGQLKQQMARRTAQSKRSGGGGGILGSAIKSTFGNTFENAASFSSAVVQGATTGEWDTETILASGGALAADYFAPGSGAIVSATVKGASSGEFNVGEIAAATANYYAPGTGAIAGSVAEGLVAGDMDMAEIAVNTADMYTQEYGVSAKEMYEVSQKDEDARYDYFKQELRQQGVQHADAAAQFMLKKL